MKKRLFNQVQKLTWNGWTDGWTNRWTKNRLTDGPTDGPIL